MNVDEALRALEKMGTKAGREGMARYAITAPKAYGVSVGNIRALGKQIGRDHALAAALWRSGWYEARMLAAFVDEPERVTPAQMDRWCKDFDNWAVCDTLCFHLFDKTPHAFAKIEQWAGRREEFVKRAAFALLASVALHDKTRGDDDFVRALPLIERAADDERNFVKKGVSWALRGIGKRRSPAVQAAARQVAERLAVRDEPAARWIGKDALREFGKVTAKPPARRAGRSPRRARSPSASA